MLRAVDYGEADRIVTLLTPDFGKLSAIARGARRSKRRFAGSLEPCCLIQVELGPTRGELARLAQASITRAFPGILRSLGKLTLAGAALELARESVAVHEPAPRLFEAIVAFFEALEVAPGVPEELWLAFQGRVLGVLGLAPGLEVCARCARRAAEGQAALFDPAVGSIVCRACGGGRLRLSGSTRARLRVAVGSGWARELEWEETSRMQARLLLQELLSRHVGRPILELAPGDAASRASPADGRGGR